MEDTEAEHVELPLHTDVRSLSSSKFQASFSELFPEVKDFLRQCKDALCAQLGDEQCLVDFLTYLTGTLNEFNTDKTINNNDQHDCISSANHSYFQPICSAKTTLKAHM